MMILGAGIVSGQDFPSKPIRIVTALAGSGNDAAARLIASGISGPLGQQVIVDNRPNILIADLVAKAPPDGYTLLCQGPILWVGPIVEGKAYDPLKDFAPLSLLSLQVQVLTVHPSLPARSVKELIALAKARPGELNYAGTTPGGNPQLGGYLLKTMAGINMVEIPYKGPGQGIIDLIGGHVQLMFSSVAGVSEHVKSGRLRALAVTTLQPSVLAPGLPTVASTLPGFELVSLDALYAPAKTPAAVVNRISQEIARYLRTTDGKEKYLALGAEAVGSTPEEHLAKMKSLMGSMSKMIRDSGMTSK